MITPQEFKVSEKLIRKRLHLSNGTVVVPFGCEDVLNEKILSLLKKRFDTCSMFIRTKPDFFVISKDEVYFVEAKQRTKNVEAIQLLYNKFCERWGIKVIYSFPELSINASLIPMEKIIIPENYRDKFDSELKHLFDVEGITEFVYVGNVTKGSGDAFVPVDLDDLKLLTDELIIQENYN